ncbi:MAG: hypothetical protein ACK5P6_09615, partial [Pseudobdellovibrionaceae bacterium]
MKNKDSTQSVLNTLDLKLKSGNDSLIRSSIFLRIFKTNKISFKILSSLALYGRYTSIRLVYDIRTSFHENV